MGSRTSWRTADSRSAATFSTHPSTAVEQTQHYSHFSPDVICDTELMFGSKNTTQLTITRVTELSTHTDPVCQSIWHCTTNSHTFCQERIRAIYRIGTWDGSLCWTCEQEIKKHLGYSFAVWEQWIMWLNDSKGEEKWKCMYIILHIQWIDCMWVQEREVYW